MIGWFVLLAITFAAIDVDAVNEAAGYSPSIFTSALDSWAAKAVILIATIGQLFCGMACLTSASRMCFAFSRDRGIPGSQVLSKVNAKGVPVAAVLSMALAALVVTLPALIGDEGVPVRVLRGRLDRGDRPLHRLRDPDLPALARRRRSFEQSPAWNLGNKWRWMNPFAVIWVGIITIIFCLPISPAAVPWNGEGGGDGKFDLKSLNYAPVTVILMLVDRRHLVEGERPQVLHRPDPQHRHRPRRSRTTTPATGRATIPAPGRRGRSRPPVRDRRGA